MSSYVYLLSDKSSYTVGMLTGASGLIQAMVAPVMGWAADKISRTKVIRASGVLGLVCIAFTALCVLFGHVPALFAAMMLWGVYWAALMPTLDAILADCVSQGQRSRVYTWRTSLILIGSAVGPAMTLFIFADLGDVWSVSECQRVILIGLCLFTAPVMLLFLLQEVRTEPVAIVCAVDENEVEAPAASEVPLEISTASRNRKTPDDDSGEGRAVANLIHSPPPDEELSSTTSVEDVHVGPSVCGLLYVPTVIAACDVISGLASGMTIKFFPIFFMNNLSMDPLKLSALYAVHTIVHLCLSLSLYHF